MDINVHFTDEDWTRIKKDWTAWWAGELERPMVAIVVEPPRELPRNILNSGSVPIPCKNS